MDPRYIDGFTHFIQRLIDMLDVLVSDMYRFYFKNVNALPKFNTINMCCP